MREDALNQLRLLDAREYLQAPAAAHALLNLDPKHALELAALRGVYPAGTVARLFRW